MVELVEFLTEGTSEDFPLQLPALPSRLPGQLEAHQTSRLLQRTLAPAMKFLVKGYVLPDAPQEAEIGSSLEVKLMLGSAQLLTGDPVCSESLQQVPVGRGVAVRPPGGRAQVAQLPQKAPQGARRGPQRRHSRVLGRPHNPRPAASRMRPPSATAPTRTPAPRTS